MNFSAHPSPGPFRNKTVLYHALGWALFIFYEVSFVTLILGNKGGSVLYDYVLPYAVNIGLFYFHAHVTLPVSFMDKRRKYHYFILLVIAELAVYLGLMGFIGRVGRDSADDIFGQLMQGNPRRLLNHLWRGIYFASFSSAYWFVLRNMASERKVLQLEKQQMQHQIDKNNLEKGYIEMQNAYLQSQVNPHMLFNTLNFVYNNVQQASQEASEAIILLSELMNFSLREQEPDGKVDLEKEVEQIKNIIKINQIRFNNKLYIDLEFNGDFGEARIIPMGLLPFVENVFKHADLTDRDYPGKITVNYNGESVELVTLNKKKIRSKAVSHGIGLVNIRKRLDNIYKNDYTLTINNDERDFYVHLVIKLNPETDD
jgi:two-component system LytT family sensor kinase